MKLKYVDFWRIITSLGVNDMCRNFSDQFGIIIAITYSYFILRRV